MINFIYIVILNYYFRKININIFKIDKSYFNILLKLILSFLFIFKLLFII